MQDALHGSLEIIAHRTDRKKNCGRDQSQWILNEESSYGRSMSALHTSKRQSVDEIKRYDADIASFNASFAKKTGGYAP